MQGYNQNDGLVLTTNCVRRDYLNETSLNEYGLQFKDVWEIGIKAWDYDRYISRYITLHHTMKQRPARSSMLELGINVSLSNKVFVHLHNNGHFLPSSSSIAGSTSFAVLPETFDSSNGRFEETILMGKAFTRKVINIVDLAKSPCNEDSRSSLTECYKTYLESKIGCKLLSNNFKQLKQNCSGPMDEARYYEEMIKVLKFPNKQRIRETGCKLPCSYTEYRSETIYNANLKGSQTSHTGELFLQFFSYQSVVPHEKEVLVYDGNNFIADVGGYLGLLLGVSILSVYKGCMEWLKLKLIY